jgi:2-dehydropantoate 2-reductase
MKVLILGVGGLGGFFGAHLQKTNCDVTFLVKDNTKKMVSENGIKILSDFGNFKINPILITKKNLKINYDVVIISCKAYHLDEAIADLKSTQKNAIIIPLLNGQAHINKLEKAFKKENVFGGVAHVSSNTKSPGEIKHVGKIKRLSIGSRHQTNQDIANEFYQLCRKADFQTVLSDNIDQDIWEKWIFIATIAGATTLFQTSIDNISKKPNGKIFIQNLWNECINISKEN